MATMKRYLYILIGLVFFSMMGCDKGFEDINSNPLNPSDVADGALFNEIVSSLRLGWSQQLFLNNEVLYDVTEQAVVTAKTFGNVTGGTEELWTNYYKALKNANELYSRFLASANDPEIANVQKAQLDILMAYKTFQMTDLFGDIPYTEAGRAFDDEPIIRARYDSQESIYKTLIEDLASASKFLLDAGQTSLGNNYLRYGAFESLFNDDLGRWIRFSNSLQLRYLIRMFEKDPDFVHPRVKEIIDGGGNTLVKGLEAVMSPRDQMWINQGVNWSFREHNKLRLGSTMWNFLTDENNDILDQRARIFFEPNVNEEWIPFPQIPDANTVQSGGEPYQQDKRDADYTDKGPSNIYASVNFYLIRDEQDIPEVLMTSAEVHFLRAEIFLRGIGTNPDPFLAAGAYENGMRESLEYWQDLMINSEIWENKPAIQNAGDFYLTSQHPKYFFDVNANDQENLNKIYAQRWLDAFRQPWEAFALLRRTNATPREKSQNSFFRFQYPPSESSLNSEHYNAQLSNMGGDETNIKMWWME